MVRIDRGGLTLRRANIRWGARTYIMAIVNVTPDSFSGDGREEPAAAIELAMAHCEAGADLLDVGGESTRPGHQPVDVSREKRRVVPVIREIDLHRVSAPISVDTYKPAVVRAAHEAGAEIVNSIWGASDALLETAAELEMPLVAMHNQIGTVYDGDVVDGVVRYLEDCAVRAVARGIAAQRIILDPGIGFGKTPDQNIAVLRSLPRIAALGFPTMLGTSRKSTIGKLTGRDAANRVYGTVATTALAVRAGFDIVRVHDVGAARDGIAVADAVVRDWRPAGWTE